MSAKDLNGLVARYNHLSKTLAALEASKKKVRDELLEVLPDGETLAGDYKAVKSFQPEKLVPEHLVRPYWQVRVSPAA